VTTGSQSGNPVKLVNKFTLSTLHKNYLRLIAYWLESSRGSQGYAPFIWHYISTNFIYHTAMGVSAN
jgi:hypothetical protein